jgi:two-component system response regulator MprA
MPQTVTPVATILVVEDSRDLTEMLSRMLGAHGFAVHSALDGESGLRMALELAPDLVILDIGLPKSSGLDVARALRERAFRAPLLMLTARGSIPDRVSGLDAGADDYLPKPFDYDELLARVKALLRRAELRAEAEVLHVGDLSLDPVSREVRRGGAPLTLTQTEYLLLEFLMRNARRVLSRERMMTHVWKRPLDPDTNIVDVYINYLRHKIDTPGRAPMLHTVRGEGYMLKE